jgi:hypothetical protein
MIEKICPLCGLCSGEKCGWYNTEQKQCAILCSGIYSSTIISEAVEPLTIEFDSDDTYKIASKFGKAIMEGLNDGLKISEGSISIYISALKASLENVLAIYKKCVYVDGKVNYYMEGMYNGLALALSKITGERVKFFNEYKISKEILEQINKRTKERKREMDIINEKEMQEIMNEIEEDVPAPTDEDYPDYLPEDDFNYDGRYEDEEEEDIDEN